MIRFESIQPLEVFEQAGMNAFRMQILRSENPYPDVSGLRGNPREAWDRGYLAASEAAFAKDQARKAQEHKDRPKARPRPFNKPIPRPYRGNKALDQERRMIGTKEVRRGK